MTWIRTGAGAALALVLSTSGLHAASAGSAPPPPPITVDPTTISDDTPFTVSGADCINPDTQSGEGNTALVIGNGLSYPNSDNPDGTAYSLVEVNADGSWSGTLTPDTREEFFGPYDDFETTVTAACFAVAPGTGEPLFEYGAVVVRYEGSRQETTTSIQQLPLPTVQEPPPAPAPGGAAPATPVPGRATFTG